MFYIRDFTVTVLLSWSYSICTYHGSVSLSSDPTGAVGVTALLHDDAQLIFGHAKVSVTHGDGATQLKTMKCHISYNAISLYHNIFSQQNSEKTLHSSPEGKRSFLSSKSEQILSFLPYCIKYLVIFNYNISLYMSILKVFSESTFFNFD